jgi:hypothetical protein
VPHTRVAHHLDECDVSDYAVAFVNNVLLAKEWSRRPGALPIALRTNDVPS